MVTIKACRDADDVRAAIAPIWHYFGYAPADEAVRNFTTLMTPPRMLCAWDGETVVGGCGSFPFLLTTPGGSVRTAGVSMVGVMPTHRRRGILRAMMQRVIEDCRERDEPTAYLWASDERIYARYGFGPVGSSGDIQVSRDHVAFLGSATESGTIRQMACEQAVDTLARIYATVAGVTPGAFARSSDWWRLKTAADPAWRRRGNGEMRCVILDHDGEPSAYALYRMNFQVERGIQGGSLDVIEAVGTSAAATRTIWRFLLDMDWTASVTASFLPTDHPLLLSAAEPRRLNWRQRDSAWLRLVNLQTALTARAYGPGEIVIEIADALCPWNAGRWRVSADGVVRTTRDADLRCDAGALACVYLGGFSWRQLVAASRADADTNDAILMADRVFEPRGAPWCPEIF